jgi:hypothetical protein
MTSHTLILQAISDRVEADAARNRRCTIAGFWGILSEIPDVFPQHRPQLE